MDPGCLSRIATERGADLLAAGRVNETDEGFELRLIIVEPGAGEALREVTQPVQGTRENIAEWLDRAVRLAFRPRALAGGLYVVGQPKGATVYVDDAVAGTVPFEEPLAGIPEGEHVVRVEAAGYADYRRTVTIRYREVKKLDVVLRALDEEGVDKPEVDVLWDVTPWAIVGVGAAVIAGGAVTGTMSWLDSIEIERRAELGHLLLPRDAELLQRGATLALASNVLYVAGGALVGAGAGMWVLGMALEPEPVRDEHVAPPVEGAPDWEELQLGTD
jgi:hypothetical protein